MSRPLSKVLREHVAGPWHTLSFRCPGCGVAHEVYLQRGDGGPVNRWDGGGTLPSLQHKVETRIPLPHGPEVTDEAAEHSLCVVRMHLGTLIFGRRCTHDLAGQTVPMQEFRHPEELPPLPKPGRMFDRENRGPRGWKAM